MIFVYSPQQPGSTYVGSHDAVFRAVLKEHNPFFGGSSKRECERETSPRTGNHERDYMLLPRQTMGIV